MGNAISFKKLTFEDIQIVLQSQSRQNTSSVLLNTLDDSCQSCLIFQTIHADKETNVMQSFIEKKQWQIQIIIYGMNCNDYEKIIAKYNKLKRFGFNNIHVYIGGLFEWLCLQDIYGSDEFPTTTKILDILKYKPVRQLNTSFAQITY